MDFAILVWATTQYTVSIYCPSLSIRSNMTTSPEEALPLNLTTLTRENLFHWQLPKWTVKDFQITFAGVLAPAQAGHLD